ncbi:hypothetical protein HEK131_06320 [Streptomyces seoulensis]|nr:hypothetical protein HEK131_06320 [Streptomyces seoulensis]
MARAATAVVLPVVGVVVTGVVLLSDGGLGGLFPWSPFPEAVRSAVVPVPYRDSGRTERPGVIPGEDGRP